MHPEINLKILKGVETVLTQFFFLRRADFVRNSKFNVPFSQF